MPYGMLSQFIKSARHFRRRDTELKKIVAEPVESLFLQTVCFYFVFLPEQAEKQSFFYIFVS